MWTHPCLTLCVLAATAGEPAWTPSELLSRAVEGLGDGAISLDADRLALEPAFDGSWTLRLRTRHGQVRLREGLVLSAEPARAAARVQAALERLMGPFRTTARSESGSDLAASGAAQPTVPAEEASAGAVGSVWAPITPRGLWELELEAALSIVYDPSEGAAGIFRAKVEHLFELPLTVGARLAPLAVGASRTDPITRPETDLLVANGWAYAGWDAHLVALRFGAGGGTLNIRPFASDATSTWMLVPGFRVGARDGLRLRGDFGIQISDSRVEFGFVDGDLFVPTGRGAAIVFRGSGGWTGHLTADVGFRGRLAGDGGPGTVFLTGTFGGAYLESTPVPDDPEATPDLRRLVGVSLGLAVTWRP